MSRGMRTVNVGADTALVQVNFQGVITVAFDDGFRSVYTNALPVLENL